MEKEKILEMSRQENKDKDLYLLEINKKASDTALGVIIIFYTLLFFLNFIAGNGYSLLLYTPVAIFNAVLYTFKYKKTEENKKTNRFAMICWTITAAIGVFGSIAEIFTK